MFHDSGTETGEEDDAKGDEVKVIAPDRVGPPTGAIVRDEEELRCVGSRIRPAKVCEETDGDTSGGQFCLATIANL